MSKDYINIVNRKAGYDYFFEEKEVAGMVLLGTEIKGIREGLVSFADGFCYFKDRELHLRGVTISNTKNSISFQHDPLRERKLLMEKKKLRKWESQLIQGISIVPIRIFVNDKGFAKIEIALAKGKKNYDKRNTLKLKDLDRELKKEF